MENYIYKISLNEICFENVNLDIVHSNAFITSIESLRFVQRNLVPVTWQKNL